MIQANVSKASIREEYLLLFILLGFSGNPFFFEWMGERSFIVLSIVVAIIAAFKRKYDVFSLFGLYVLPFLLLHMYHLVRFDEAKLSTIIFFMMKTFIGVGLLRLIGKSFAERYFNMMAALAGISLICFFYNCYVGKLPGIVLDERRSSIIVYTQIYGEYFLLRNAGMFWEPGSFQGFLNMALFFSMIIPTQKYMKIKLLLIVAAILTTFSTTGYIALAFVAVLYVANNKRIGMSSKIFMITLLVLGAFIAYSSLSFLEQKIVENANSAEGGRITGYIQWLNNYTDSLFLGRSYISTSDNELVFSGGNGFISHLVYIGIFGVIYYYSTIYSRMKKQTGKGFAFLFLLFLALIYQGEGFITHPLFLAISFAYFPLKNNLNTNGTKKIMA